MSNVKKFVMIHVSERHYTNKVLPFLSIGSLYEPFSQSIKLQWWWATTVATAALGQTDSSGLRQPVCAIGPSRHHQPITKKGNAHKQCGWSVMLRHTMTVCTSRSRNSNPQPSNHEKTLPSELQSIIFFNLFEFYNRHSTVSCGAEAATQLIFFLRETHGMIWASQKKRVNLKKSFSHRTSGTKIVPK